MRKLYEPKKAKLVVKQKTHFGDIISIEKYDIVINKHNDVTRGVTELRQPDPRQSFEYRAKSSLRKTAYIFSRDEKSAINRK